MRSGLPARPGGGIWSALGLLTDRTADKSNAAQALDDLDVDDSIEYWLQPWPFGTLGIGLGRLGLRRILWSRESDSREIRRDLAREFGAGNVRERKPEEDIAAEFEAYFDGRLERFESAVDARPKSAFQERVLRRLLHTRSGELTTYGALATAVGKPGAARAVGRVMATNPLPIVIPCHRVLPADGSLGNYTGGVDIKERLLAIEGVRLPARASL